jgi:glycosyltransferase involved in cell wall biosynthesis
MSARDQLLEAEQFVEWEEWPLVGRAERLNSLLQPSYISFYGHARKWIRQALARGEQFDVIHQLTPMAMRYPSPAAGLTPRLIVGPVAGALPTPSGFRSELSSAAWYTKLRAFDRWRFRHDPMLRRSMASAGVLIGAAPYVRDILADVPLRRFEVMCEIGVAELPLEAVRPDRPEGYLRGLFVGRLIRSKGARDAIRALAALPHLPDVTLDIVGDGEDRSACEAEAQSLGVGGRVRFHGWLPRSEVDRFYREADAFVFPSFREPTGNVVIEAMSHGLPVVASDYGGPADLLGATAGISVSTINPQQYAAAIADALHLLAGDPRKRIELGKAARRRVREVYLWSSKVRWLEALYNDVIGLSAGYSSSTRPSTKG